MTAPPAGLVFDAYGTLFDLSSAWTSVASRLGSVGPELAAIWRTKQLEYTWLRSLMGQYADFWEVTGDALDYTMDRLGLRDPALRRDLMQAYLCLDTYPEVKPVLSVMRRQAIPIVILSNGSPSMLASAVASAELGDFIDRIFSVEAVAVYKPSPRAYRLAADGMGLGPASIAFVSGNGWDVAGAAAFGFRAIWLNRVGQAVERLPGRPTAIITSLSELPAKLGFE